MIIVTGGAGFIGSNLIHQLNRDGERDILLVDNFAPAPNLTGPKFLNLAGAEYADYMDKREFRAALKAGDFENAKVRAILHQGACSNTLEDDGRYMMDNNFTYSKELLHFALDRKIPLVYASTAAIYGASTEFTELPKNERPLNVYGPREQHKGRMASVLHHFTRQLKDTGTIRMFEGSGGYANGEQRRDFVFVKDLAHVNMFFAGLLPESPKKAIHAVVNAGTGEARAFNAVAAALMQVHGPGKIDYIPFPGDLKNRYQHYTQADVTGLRAAGYTAPFTTLEDGVKQTFAEEP